MYLHLFIFLVLPLHASFRKLKRSILEVYASSCAIAPKLAGFLMYVVAWAVFKFCFISLYYICSSTSGYLNLFLTFEAQGKFLERFSLYMRAKHNH
jgi:hypothetical protein